MFNIPAQTPKIPATRLQQNFLPISYDIFIHPNIPAKSFFGRVSITFIKKFNSPVFQLHADQSLKIKTILQSDTKLSFKHLGCVLQVDCSSPESSPILIEYEGSLNHKNIGFYYVNDEMCATQFEPNDARKAFPCFDEPFAKATFHYSFQTKSDLIVLTNMPSTKETPTANGEKITEFMETPLMSTYLVAFGIGKYDKVSGVTKRGLPVDVYASRGTKPFLKFPLEETIRAVEWLENFYEIEFNLPKLQLLGVPKFLFGGMENYGLITIVESLLVANEGDGSVEVPQHGNTMMNRVYDMLTNPMMVSQVRSFLSNPQTMQILEGMASQMGLDEELTYETLLLFQSQDVTNEISQSVRSATATDELTKMESQFLKLIGNVTLLEQLAELMRGRSLSQLSSMMNEQTLSFVMGSLSMKSKKSMAAQVIDHEVAHQWCGDMVSPVWWNALWLNEGFATLFPILMFDDFHPDFSFIKYYDSTTNQLALVLDSVDTMRPIHGQVVEEGDPFDLISYNKAGFVLGMLRRIVGPDAFRSAVQKFTRDFFLKAADTNDLLKSFSESFGRDMRSFFNSWIYNPGFPLIVVEEGSLRQMPFSGLQVWEIPLKIIYEEKGVRKTTEVILKDEGMELNLDAEWLIVNPGLESFCRVWYNGDLLFSAAQAAKSVLTDDEKSHFIADQQFLHKRGFITDEEIQELKSVLNF